MVNKYFLLRFFLLLVSLDVCWETQKGQSVRLTIGGYVEVRNDLGNREAASRALLCGKGVRDTVCARVFSGDTGLGT